MAPKLERLRSLAVAVVVLSLADAAVAAGAAPFTTRADVVTSVGIAGVVGVGAWWRLRDPAADARAEAPPPSLSSRLVWLGVIIVIAAFELVELFSSPRSSHPTFSSILALVDGHAAVRCLLFLAW
ncbi:MAG TPA: hypothetical protein VGP46_13895, partial [Acidimicrobiales bacterium]|nr:hypothetical protein [Acidimicrobiales bacterium]